MGLHENAWNGINLLVFGKQPMLPMQIEQALAAVSPANEIRIYSYENYEDALDFCKSNKQVGMFLLLDEQQGLPISDIYRELKKPYEKNGLPAFGILLYETDQKLHCLRCLKDDASLLDYVSTKEILEESNTKAFLEKLWENYIHAFDNRIAPEGLRESLESIAINETSRDSLIFSERLFVILSANLNISWMESIALRWKRTVDIVQKKCPEVLEPHTFLVQVTKLISNEPLVDATIFNKEISLVSRIYSLGERLLYAQQNGTIAALMAHFGTLSKPGAPAIIRNTVKVKEKIIEVANQEQQNNISYQQRKAS